MNDWENLTEEERTQFIKLIQEKYPEIILELFNAIQPLIAAMQPVFDIVNMIMTHIWEIIKKQYSKEQLENMIRDYEPSTNRKTTDIKK